MCNGNGIFNEKTMMICMDLLLDYILLSDTLFPMETYYFDLGLWCSVCTVNHVFHIEQLRIPAIHS